MIRDAGDILDRFSIATLKMERISSPGAHKEFELFKEGYLELLNKYKDEDAYIENTFKRLLNVNSQIWDLESAIRQRHLDGDVMEVGRRAIEIRKINTRRIVLCNEVNRHFGEGVENVKKYHLSE